MKDSAFFIRIMDIVGINRAYAPRYRSIFHEEPCGRPGLRLLVSNPDSYEEWTWLSSDDKIRQCYIQLKVKRVL